MCTSSALACSRSAQICVLNVHSVVHYTCAQSSFPKSFQCCPFRLSQVGHCLYSCVHNLISNLYTKRYVFCCAVTPHVHKLCIERLFILRICVSSIGGAISIRDPYICAVSLVCANESHAVFHGPVVCAVKT